LMRKMVMAAFDREWKAASIDRRATCGNRAPLVGDTSGVIQAT